MPSATISSTSSYCSATVRVDSVIDAIQPWSAAGAEKPMVTVSPASSLEPSSASDVPPSRLSLESSGSLLVQALRPSTANTARVATTNFGVEVICFRDMWCSLVVVRDGWCGVELMEVEMGAR